MEKIKNFKELKKIAISILYLVTIIVLYFDSKKSEIEYFDYIYQISAMSLFFIVLLIFDYKSNGLIYKKAFFGTPIRKSLILLIRTKYLLFNNGYIILILLSITPYIFNINTDINLRLVYSLLTILQLHCLLVLALVLMDFFNRVGYFTHFVNVFPLIYCLPLFLKDDSKLLFNPINAGVTFPFFEPQNPPILNIAAGVFMLIAYIILSFFLEVKINREWV